MRKYIISLVLLFALGHLLAVCAYAEADAIQDLLDALNEEETAASESPTEDSDADAIQKLLDDLDDDNSIDNAETDAETETPQSEESEEAFTEEIAGTDPDGAVTQEDYVLLDGYDLTSLNETVALQVPSAWGNNAGASETMVSYSPANQSGATDPHSSTLSTIWYNTGISKDIILDEYLDNIRKQDFFSDVEAQPFTVAGQEGLSISYNMDVGSNSFECKSACFVYGDILYSVEMCQGVKSTKDYFPVFQDVVGSEAIMDGEWDLTNVIPETEPETEPTPVPETESETEPTPDSETESETELTPVPETESETEPTPDSETEPETEPTPVPETEPETEPTPVPETESETELTPVPETESETEPTPDSETEHGSAPQGGDLGDFTYAINGHTYQFPTAISALAQGDLSVDLSLELSAEDDSSAAGNELVNTLYFVQSNFPARELIGVTNLTGANAPMSEGILTALVDTTPDTVHVELPGGLKIGSPEASISQAFPEFADISMDGLADFRGNELLYACNVRDDGCNGYVIIRNDAPYCSTLSIICENGVIREINFQCLGSSVLGLFE